MTDGGERLKRTRPMRGLPLRHAKVEQLGTGLRQHHVGGLQVAVNDAVPMRMIERLGDLDRMAQDLVSGKGPRARRCATVSPSNNSITR